MYRFSTWINSCAATYGLVYVLVKKDLQVRYKSSLFGYFWALLNPVAFAAVYYIAFKLILNTKTPDYSIYLLAGIFPWSWLATSLNNSAATLRNNSTLVKKVNIKKFALPLASVCSESVHFICTMPVIIMLIILVSGKFYISWIYQIPLMLIAQFLLIYPLAVLLSLANAYVRDVEYVTGLFLSLLFFLTPIVYTPDQIPIKYASIFQINPFYTLIANWKNVYLSGMINYDYLGITFSICIAAWFIAIWVYLNFSYKVSELL